MTETDRRMMAQALALAQKGVGQVSPGPLVGCVIVSSSGEVVGEGFYLFEELNHAETIALATAGEKARGGTAYVSLEPHAHHGRTPPCTDALIAAGKKFDMKAYPMRKHGISDEAAGRHLYRTSGAPMSAATSRRAAAMRRAARRPAACVDAGLPCSDGSARHSDMAPATRGSSGAVAAWSR